MAKKLRLTGRASFSSPLTFRVGLMLNQVILVDDATGTKLLALVNREADPDVNVFTLLSGSEPVNYDFTKGVPASPQPDGSLVIDPQQLPRLSYRIPKGTTLRNLELVPYGWSDGIGGYTPNAQALVTGPGILQRGAAPYTTPTFGGTNGAMTFGSKKRRMDWAGTPGQYVYRSATMHMSDLQFGTRTTDSPVSLSASAYATDIETGGAQPALYTPVTTAGVMSIAGGRFRQRADGSVRIMHYADDALYSSSPRFQFTSFLMPNRVPLRTSLVVQFGDAETPWPAYVATKQNCLFWQIKGATGQPPMALNVERQADGSLKLYFNRKKSNATSIYTAGTVSGLAVNTPISIQIDYTLDWLTMDEAGKAFVSLTVNGAPVMLTDSAGDVEGAASVCMPTVFTDVDQAYTMINGIYRYDYTVKAPNDAAMIYWKHETSVRAA